MSKKQYKLILLVPCLALVLLLSAVFISKKDPGVIDTHISVPTTSSSEQENQIPPEEANNTISVALTAGDTNVELSPTAGMTLYDALVEAKENGALSFSGKEYSGLGFFVSDIGTLHQTAGTNMIYYINSKEASVGVSAYILKDGDVIEWKLN